MCGLSQISVIILDADLNQMGQFNEFIKPPKNAIWCEQAWASHKYHKEHPSIVAAQPIDFVWPRMVRGSQRLSLWLLCLHRKI